MSEPTQEDLLELMAQDLRRQGDVLAEQVELARSAAEDLPSAVGRRPSRVYLVGCGDSLDGALAARPAWERLFTVPVEAVPAMAFAGYTVDVAPPGSLVVALSQSGRVTRVVEAVRAARDRGLATVSMTSSPGSPVAEEPADAVLVTPFPKLGPVPGFTSYVAGSLAFAEVGCALSEDDGARRAVRDAVDTVPALADRTIAAAWEAAEAQVDGLGREAVVMALASGPFMAAARHVVRKVLETSQLVALAQDTEEYAHDEYSAVDERFCVLLHAPHDRTWTRSAEVAGYLERLGVRLGVVDPASHPVPSAEERTVHYGLPPCDPLVAPVLYSLPGQVVSHLLAVRLGGSMYGMADPVKRADGDPQIYDSQIVIA